jgi:putative ABC transport system substrate-binding protein
MASGKTEPMGPELAAALLHSLRLLGWRDGDNLHIDWRWGDGDPARFGRDAAELVALKPDLLFAQGSPSVAALRKHTRTIPIVFAMVTDPIDQGFADSLARPNGNITGFSDFNPGMAGKWLEMLTQLTPPAAHVAVLYNAGTAPYAGAMLHTLAQAAPAFTVAVTDAPCHDAAGIEAMMAALAREEHGAVLVLTDIFNAVHRDTIVAGAARHRLPAVYFNRSFAAAGGLMSYGIDHGDLFRRAAGYVDRILNGTAVTDLPLQQPTKFELVINLKTARALDVTVAPALLATADDVIE